MTTQSYHITPQAVRHYADMVGVPLTDAEVAELSAQLAGGFAGLAELWRVDVADVEPSVILPIDRR